ncbi:hypothetical protein, partial [Escherichia coli]|uniref:hypothetical protein n=1 Tax=Escherichia coli TaxID=562 RepID=UPI003EBE80F6
MERTIQMVNYRLISLALTCRNPACSRKIFAESLAPFASSHQQSSQALQNLQRQLGLIAGG